MYGQHNYPECNCCDLLNLGYVVGAWLVELLRSEYSIAPPDTTTTKVKIIHTNCMCSMDCFCNTHSSMYSWLPTMMHCILVWMNCMCRSRAWVQKSSENMFGQNHFGRPCWQYTVLFVGRRYRFSILFLFMHAWIRLPCLQQKMTFISSLAGNLYYTYIAQLL